MSRLGNGAGTVYEYLQRQRKKPFDKEGECNTCKNCTDRSKCDNRVGYIKCDRCERCKDCITYCDRFYVYDKRPSGQITDEKTGKRIYTGGGKNKSEAIAKKKKAESGKKINKSDVTLYFYANEIVEERHQLNPKGTNTYKTNKSILKRLNNSPIIHKSIQKVEDKDIITFLASKTVCSDSVIKKDYNIVKNAFTRAVRNKVIEFNPLDEERFAKPKSEVGTKKVRTLM